MKKTLLLITLMLLAVVDIQAQSLYGKWHTKMADDEMNADVYISFVQSGKCELKNED